MFYISSIFYKRWQEDALTRKLERRRLRQPATPLTSASSGTVYDDEVPGAPAKPDTIIQRAARIEKHGRSGQPEGEEYDPHQNRIIKKPLSNVEATILIIKGSLGTGFLAMPLAFNLAGYITTIICWILLTVIMIYCLHILLESMYKLCKRAGIPALSYPKAIRLALAEGPSFLRMFSVPSIIIADIVLISYHMCVCVIYIMFISTNVKDLIDQYLLHMDSRFLMCISVLPLLPLVVARRLKTLIPLWTLAVFLQLMSLFLIILYAVASLPEFNTEYLFAPTHNYPDGIALILLSFQSVGVILPVEAQMANPKAFLGTKGIVVRTHIILILCYMTLGFFGFWRFGIEVEDNVALNLSEYEITPQLIRMSLALAMFLSFPLQAYAIVDAIWHHWLAMLIHKDDRRTLEYVVRCLVVMCAAICSVCFISLTYMLLLVASLCLSILGITFPALIDVCVRQQSGYGRFKIYLVRDICLLIFGCTLSVLCFVTAVTPSVESYRVK